MINKIAIALIIAALAIHINGRRGAGESSLLPSKAIVGVIVEETAERTPGQALIIDNGAIRDYVNEKALKDDKGNPEFRVWDKDMAMTGDVPKPLKDAFTLANGKPVPYLVVSNGRAGYAGKLPATPAATLATLQKYGGK